MAREVRESQAQTAFAELFGGVAMTLAGRLRLAGKTELAARVKPSTRRPGQTAGDAEEPPPAAQAVK